MESLGLLHAARELNQIIVSSPKSNKTSIIGTHKKPKCKERNVELTPIRRSSRLKAIYSDKNETLSPCTSDFEEEILDLDPDRQARIARRCDCKGRGSIYDPILGICCHFCR
jgi:cell division cycle-associated protein 7